MNMYEKLEKKIHDYIPLAKTMSIKVHEVTQESVSLTLPKGPNRNHMGSVFGGSLHTAAVLSCWSLLEELFEDEKISIDYTVIQSSDMKYIRPVRGDFLAKSTYVGPEERKQFLENLKRKNRARIFLSSTIIYKDQTCAEFKGGFVAQISER